VHVDRVEGQHRKNAPVIEASFRPTCHIVIVFVIAATAIRRQLVQERAAPHRHTRLSVLRRIRPSHRLLEPPLPLAVRQHDGWFFKLVSAVDIRGEMLVASLLVLVNSSGGDEVRTVGRPRQPAPSEKGAKRN